MQCLLKISVRRWSTAVLPARGIDLLQGFLHNWKFFPSCYENAESEIAEASALREEPGLTLLSALNPELKNEVILQGEEEWPQN